jgi:hypothetical protein
MVPGYMGAVRGGEPGIFPSEFWKEIEIEKEGKTRITNNSTKK